MLYDDFLALAKSLIASRSDERSLDSRILRACFWSSKPWRSVLSCLSSMRLLLRDFPSKEVRGGDHGLPSRGSSGSSNGSLRRGVFRGRGDGKGVGGGVEDLSLSPSLLETEVDAIALLRKVHFKRRFWRER